MRISLWYRTEAEQPSKSGYYLTYRGWGMGGKSDYDHDHGYLYYDKNKDEWREHYTGDDKCSFVYYWSDADPYRWVDSDPPSIHIKKARKNTHPALQDAWAAVEDAINRYKELQVLCDES
jgi:hypothetical protein